jgi:phospholipid-transporting ATPase
MAEISQEEYDRWSDIYYRASTSLENRDEKVDEAAELIEKVNKKYEFDVVEITSNESVACNFSFLVQNLFLLGATAIEDKLQEVL